MSSAKSRHFKADLAKAIKYLRGDDGGKEGSKKLKKKGIKTGTEKKKRKSRGGKGRGKGAKGAKGKKRKAGEDGEDDAEDDNDEEDDGEDWFFSWQLSDDDIVIIIWLTVLLCLRTITSIPTQIPFLRMMMGRTGMLDWMTKRKKIRCECQSWIMKT